jgi:hypothetical protein
MEFEACKVTQVRKVAGFWPVGKKRREPSAVLSTAAWVESPQRTDGRLRSHSPIPQATRSPETCRAAPSPGSIRNGDGEWKDDREQWRRR